MRSSRTARVSRGSLHHPAPGAHPAIATWPRPTRSLPWRSKPVPKLGATGSFQQHAAAHQRGFCGGDDGGKRGRHHAGSQVSATGRIDDLVAHPSIPVVPEPGTEQTLAPFFLLPKCVHHDQVTTSRGQSGVSGRGVFVATRCNAA